VLHETALAAAPQVLGLNVTRGCGHRCAFCSVRASPQYPSDEVILFANTVELLAAELRESRPRSVYLCPGADPFPPYAPVQELVGDVVECLAAHGVESWLMTRGEVLSPVVERLRPLAPQIRFTVALPTLHTATAALLEADAAPPVVRLEMIERLRSMGFAVQVALDPLVPQLTDTPEALEPLLAALAACGITTLTAGYLFLRGNIMEQMKICLPGDVCSAIFAAYENGPVLESPGLAGARYLPRARRQRGYAALMAMASRHGMRVGVSALTNPDFTPSKPTVPTGTSLLAAYRQAIRRSAV
jgi:DNA repair photolyase